jgi:hypothetical protein
MAKGTKQTLKTQSVIGFNRLERDGTENRSHFSSSRSKARRSMAGLFRHTRRRRIANRPEPALIWQMSRRGGGSARRLGGFCPAKAIK